uniref:Uncharacterized protein n=1 Tax=Anguilla anguilla TaxID=7936 RepID=A0A0E9UGR6_ANGAN
MDMQCILTSTLFPRISSQGYVSGLSGHQC